MVYSLSSGRGGLSIDAPRAPDKTHPGVISVTQVRPST